MVATHRATDTELATTGLSGDQVQELTREGKTNTVDTSTSRPVSAIARTHLFTLFNLVLGLCGLAVILLGRWLDMLFLLAAVTNVVVGFVQEYSAKKKLDAIALLRRDPATVVRDGAVQQVALNELVLHDVVVLKRGDQVPADARVLTSDGLDLDESMLTGENDPVAKKPGDTVLSASSVVHGTGRVQIFAVGSESHANKLAHEARQFSQISSELRAGMERVVKWITFALIPIIAIVVNGQMVAAGGWQYALDSGAWQDTTIVAVSSIASMIPQGLALMTTISFAVAAVKLAQDEVLIQEQPAVEVLARVDVVCFDKTGTLTEGGVGFNDAVEFPGAPSGWQRALAWFGADENANPTAAALGEEFTEVPAQPAAATIAFSSAQRFSAVEFETGAWVLGAPEALLPADSPERVRAAKLAASGLRTMVLSHAPSLPRGADGKALTDKPDATPAVLITFREQVRAEAPETLRYFTEQGIDLKVFSGDNPQTVAAAARIAGMDVENGAIDASTLPENGKELAQAALTHNVFGRVSPKQKKNMVLALQEAGHTVAMTGDGINDALALKHADLGIAMGNAAPATKAVSRLILLDGRFDRLPSVLAEGRKIIANIERVTNLFLTKTGFAIALGVLLGILCWKFPLLPRQYSTADLLIVGGPAFFLTMMHNTRRYVPGFLQRALHFAIPSALIVALTLVAVNFVGRALFAEGVASGQQLQTATLITLVLLGLWNLTTAVRPLDAKRAALVAAMYAGLALAVLVPASQWYHQFEFPAGQLLTTCLVAGVVGSVLIEINYRYHKRWMHQHHPEAVEAAREARVHAGGRA
ncbi:HAD-IC family P-type ATPase [Rothia sp. ZJ1223]|uniref:HAD-IC family P-type ATPase n=1 Tax=Rothia sp. ZJ1223 TaxID=2811098 RepID=UPI001958EE4D|nr:HAD-IC family P-type ATPase [Rothia sp. ZJ1223]MBM7052167.1 HAD-IC family P-type ATPase [Rothia sp. ZJ1223]